MTRTVGGELAHLLQARRPAVYFAAKIGDAVLTLPTLRALGDMFDAPLTLICPRFAFSLCFREVSPRLVDSTGCFGKEFPPILGATPAIDCETLASQIGAVDVLINTVSFNLPSDPIRTIRQRLAPTATIGLKNDYEEYEVVVGKKACHSADFMFELARVFDPSLRIESYAQPVPIPPAVQEQARSIRATLPPGTKVLVVHADTDWTAKRWPVTRFIDVLNRFLSQHRDFVAWIVGMGHEELNVGPERDRVISHLGLPLDLSMSLVASADLFLGIDSCMLHAADLAQVPGVGLFGPTRAAQWGFRFAPHRHLDVRTTADISVEDVLSAMEEVVEQHV
jgi:ADP-heptose:LPS heptosyltransferase